MRDLVGGADYAFEALGRDETIKQAWASLDIRGQLVLVGLLPGGARLTLDSGPFLSEQSVRGCYFVGRIRSLETFHDEYVCFVRLTTTTGQVGWGQTSTYNADITARSSTARSRRGPWERARQTSAH